MGICLFNSAFLSIVLYSQTMMNILHKTCFLFVLHLNTLVAMETSIFAGNHGKNRSQNKFHEIKVLTTFFFDNL